MQVSVDPCVAQGQERRFSVYEWQIYPADGVVRTQDKGGFISCCLPLRGLMKWYAREPSQDQSLCSDPYLEPKHVTGREPCVCYTDRNQKHNIRQCLQYCVRSKREEEAKSCVHDFTEDVMGFSARVYRGNSYNTHKDRERTPDFTYSMAVPLFSEWLGLVVDPIRGKVNGTAAQVWFPLVFRVRTEPRIEGWNGIYERPKSYVRRFLVLHLHLTLLEPFSPSLSHRISLGSHICATGTAFVADTSSF